MSKKASNKEPENSSYNEKAFHGPVYFLIREQAKSVVAIKELQARLTVLESLQERLMQAVHNVQHHLISDKASSDIYDDCRCEIPISHYEKSPESAEVTSSSNEHDNKTELLNLIPSTKVDSKSESINKDSGVISDYKGNSADSSYVPYNSSELLDYGEQNDELLKLLDIIDQKSLRLLHQVEDIGYKTDSNGMTSENDYSHTNSYAESFITQRQLCEIRADRDELKQRLSKLELATDTVIKEKKKLQKKLESVALENHELQEKIQNASSIPELHTQQNESHSLSSMSDIQKATIRKKYMQYSEKSRLKVANVLKETQVLELQRQLLTYIMENDVLQAKLEQSQPSSWATWLKIESKLKKELQIVNRDKKALENALREKQIEVLNLKTRIKFLEDTLEKEKPVENFGLNSTDDWRQYGNQCQKSNLNALSPLEFGDFSKTQSLPVEVRLDAQNNSQAMFERSFNLKHFTDVSLNSCNSDGKEYFCSDKDKNLLDLTDSNESESSTSRLLHLQYWNQPAISADWSTIGSLGCSHNQSNHMFQQNNIQPHSLVKDSSAKLINGHLCWKGNVTNPANDLDSICTEFDPLTSVPSCENFVDSLNLSIPLKPTQVVSHLSSVGDSLHSTSLDLGCTSPSTWHHNNELLCGVNSVDGVKKFLIDSNMPNFYSRTSQSSAQNYTSTPSLSEKSVHALNVLGCMQNVTNNKLL